MNNGMDGGMMGAMGALMNPQRLMDRMFKKAPNIVWDMMTGKVGVRTRSGIVTLEHTPGDPNATPPTEDTFQTVENPIDGFGMAVPAFAQQTALDSVKPGDLIQRDSGTGWVTKVNAKSVVLIKPDGQHTTFTPPKTQILDLGSGVMVVRSLFNMLPNGATGVNTMMQQVMQMQMMGQFMGNDTDDMLGEMLPFMLMMSGAGATSGVQDQASNPMAGMFGNMQQLMPMMMMARFMGGNKGSNGGGGVRRPRYNNPNTPFDV